MYILLQIIMYYYYHIGLLTKNQATSPTHANGGDMDTKLVMFTDMG